MGKLADTIRRLVAEEKYVVGEHAARRLEERGILEWQAVLGLENGELLLEVAEHAEQGDIEWLQWHGRVYQALEAG
jgi:hypothetical protein